MDDADAKSFLFAGLAEPRALTALVVSLDEHKGSTPGPVGASCWPSTRNGR